MMRRFFIYLVMCSVLFGLPACATTSQPENNNDTAVIDTNPAENSLTCQPTQPLNLRPGPGTSFKPPPARSFS